MNLNAGYIDERNRNTTKFVLGENASAFYNSINITPGLTGFKEHSFILPHFLCNLGRAYLGPNF